MPEESGIEEGTLAPGRFSVKTPKPKPPDPVPTHSSFHFAAWTTIENYNSQAGLRSSSRDQWTCDTGPARTNQGQPSEALSLHRGARRILPPPGPRARAPRPARLSSRALPSPFSLLCKLAWLLGPKGRPDRKSTRLNSSHSGQSRMPSSA